MSTSDPVWPCGICGQKGPLMFNLWWRDGTARYEVPGGQTVYLEEQPRLAWACSEKCARTWAKAVGSDRISITRPEGDDRRRLQDIALSRQDRQRQHQRRRAA